GPDGLPCIHLDLTHLGADRINSRLPLIREVCIKFIGLDPIDKPIPIRPVAHYSMGGVETDIDGATRIPGIWAAGEAAAVSLHGANRLGSNSTGECLVWGAITGAAIANALATLPAPAPVPEAVLRRCEGHIREVMAREGSENLYGLRRELRTMMDRDVGVFRRGDELCRGLSVVREIRERSHREPVHAKGALYNSNLFNALELENLLDLAEVTIVGALAREESRGAHARRDFDSRNDEQWLKHTLAWYTGGAPRLDHKPVTLDAWKPVERKY
ncbi:MAG: FAD-binding protein, partial [Acidobacteria bacterium]